MRPGLRSCIALVVIVSCADNHASRVTCEQMADHVADVIIADFTAHPDEFWDVLHAQAGHIELPADVTKETFGGFLATPEGKAWMQQRHEGARSGTHKMIETCAARATKAQVNCVLGAKTRAAVQLCDLAP